MQDINQQKKFPKNVSNLLSQISLLMPLHQNFLNLSLSKITDIEINLFEKYLNFCEQQDLSMQYMAKCYATIVEDTINEQIYFRKNKKYRHDSFESIAKDVYFNADYMAKYMYGLAITGYFWPNHLEMYRFFENTLPRHIDGRYLEIGPGHGNYMMRAMETSSYKSFTGIDISKTSIEMTDKILKEFLPIEKQKYDLQCIDFLEFDLPYKTYDAIVMGEVLEHVERPDIFLKRICDIASNEAYIFITTCANAPAVDHIYLYKSPKEVEEQIKDCGLEIVHPLILPYEGKTVEQCEKLMLSINVAYVLKKRA